MQVRFLNQPVRLFVSKEHGSRLLFVNGAINPRDKLGTMGVSFHGTLGSLVRSTVRVKLPVVDSHGVITHTNFNINRNSLLHYLRACQPHVPVDDNLTDDGITDILENMLHKNQHQEPVHDQEQHFHAPAQMLKHAGQYNNRLLSNKASRFFDDFRGRFLSWLYQSTILSVARLHKRFIFARTEAAYFNTGSILAKYRFKKAYETVPAYREFVTNNGPADLFTSLTARFVDVPITSKENYIQVYKSVDWKLHVGGKYPVKNKVDTSTGTTGKATPWVRGDDELRTVKYSLRVAAEIEYGRDRKLQYVNAFALGPWATGMTANELMRTTGSNFAAGPDIDKILDYLENRYNYEQSIYEQLVDGFLRSNANLQPRRDMLLQMVMQLVNHKLDDKDFDLATGLTSFLQMHPVFAPFRRALLKMLEAANAEKPQTIIAGYPPFLDQLADVANKRGINFKKYRARGVVGGQAISEALRDKLVHSGYAHINSSYGASDCDINIGVETEFEIRFRKILEKNPRIAEELYGKNMGVPMVFHFDPFNYFIESNEVDDLLFTCTRSDRSSPRIRYNLGDKGRVYAASDIEALLVKHGIDDVKPKINFPLLCVWGRDSAVAYRGSKVSFTDLERAITDVDDDSSTFKRAFYSTLDEEGHEKFEIWVELKEGFAIPTEEKSQEFLAEILLSMAKVNQDFKYHLDIKDDAKLPELKIFTHGKSPISDPGGHRKQVLVFKDNNLPKDYQFPEDPQHMRSVSIPKAFLPTVLADVGHGNGSPRFLRRAPSQPQIIMNGGVEYERVKMRN